MLKYHTQAKLLSDWKNNFIYLGLLNIAVYFIVQMDELFVPKCAFTNAASNRDHFEKKPGICRGTKGNNNSRSHLNYIGCFNCSGGRKCIWRCSECYMRFQRTITRDNIVRNPILDLLFEIDFDNNTDKTILAYCKIFLDLLYYKPVTWLSNKI